MRLSKKIIPNLTNLGVLKKSVHVPQRMLCTFFFGKTIIRYSGLHP